MLKKIIALLLSCVMLLSIVPAAAAEDAPAAPAPTIKEIMDEYRRKSFEAQFADQLDAATYSGRSSANSNTLEQETVVALTAAGYEAYNVTANNYASLEILLATDFEQMNLDPNGNYIVVVGGENLLESFVPQSRVAPLPEYDHIGDGSGGDPTFQYTYNGTTYTMRNVFIFATDDPIAIKAETVNLLNSQPNLSNLDNLLNSVLYAVVDYILEDCLIPVPLGTIASMCGLSVFNFKNYDQSILELQVGAAWTRVYTQVWSETLQEWLYGAMVEYTDITSCVTGRLYNGIRWVNLTEDPSNETIYSEYFHDPNWRKQTAIRGHYSGQMIQDRTGSITFKFEDQDVVTLPENF